MGHPVPLRRSLWTPLLISHRSSTDLPPQVALIGIQFIWTLDSEYALYRSKTEKGVMNSMNRKNLQRLNDLIAINLKTDKELSEFGKWTRKKVETMILVDVHQRDVFDELVKKKIKDMEDFEWLKQACHSL